MKRTSAELKQIARYNLQGHYGVPIGALVVAELIPMAALFPFTLILDIYNSPSDMLIYQLAAFILGLVSAVFQAGLIRIHFKLARKETPVFTDLFFGFTRRPDRFILASLVSSLVCVICLTPGIICLVLYYLYDSVVLLMPGILLSLAGIIVNVFWVLMMGLTALLLTEHDSMGVIEAFKESIRLMSGNKSRMLYISFSFLGWSMLAILSCSIGMLWLTPYMNQTTVEFYRDVTGELNPQ